jgi:hypothetical protein
LQVKRIILAVFGFAAVIVGWGMERSPRIEDFGSLVSSIADEIVRLAGDPTAILGLMIMLLGIWVLFKALFGSTTGEGLLPFGRKNDEFP